MPKVKIVSSDIVKPLRHKVLRPRQPFESCILPHDDDLTTIHFACYNENEILSVASIFHQSFDDVPGVNAYRLRGMATEPSHQGKGYGKLVLIEAMEYIKENTQATMLWCNARAAAFGFYEKMGFSIVGKEFDIPNIGPHKKGYIHL